MKRILRQAENKFKVELTKKAVENSALRDEVRIDAETSQSFSTDTEQG